MREPDLINRSDGKYQRAGIDHDPVEPWVWATYGITSAPVEVVSYPIPGAGSAVRHADATVMIRWRPGDPTSITEVPLRAIAAFHPSRHEWCQRPRRYYGDNPTAFIFTDEENPA